MPKLTIDGVGEFVIQDGTRLVNALLDHGGDPLHRCGGYARCGTCLVEFISGEPDTMTEAEKNKLKNLESPGKSRLSCQCTVDQDMHVKVLKPFSESGYEKPGPRPKDHITP
jgi:ferredoxin